MSEFNVGVCKDNEVIKEIFKEYSQIKVRRAALSLLTRSLLIWMDITKVEHCSLEARTGLLLEALLSGRLMMLSVKPRDYSSSLSFAVKAMRE